MKMIRYVGGWIAAKHRERQRVWRDYEAAYRRCFEGTQEEMAIRLEAWDYAHRMTRSQSSSYI
ncbi:MAG: hypothetical protein HY514_01345 [Candidatus Aenigmarchaeota archaeon]|nr:hypothetical protein [Candidatus Aenigmarchaeota archaeon]